MSAKKKIILTGLTSFTGAYIAKALLEGDYKVICPVKGVQSFYSDLKKKRIELAKGVQIVENIDITSEQIISLCQEIQPRFFINHAGYIDNYRSDDFDVLKHLQTNLANIRQLVRTLKENGCQLFIHTGSSFEPGGEYSDFGLSPYGVAKKMVWDLTLFWCHKYSLSAVKIVVPNPYGELENEDRLLPVFTKKIMNGESLVLNDPKAVRNNIKVSELAKFYLKAIQDFKEEGFSFEEIKPHGYIETQKDFVERALQERPYNLSLDEIRKYVKIL